MTISTTPNGNGGAYAVDSRRKTHGSKWSVATANLKGGNTIQSVNLDADSDFLDSSDDDKENDSNRRKSKAGRKPKQDPMEVMCARLGDMASQCVADSAATRQTLGELVQTARDLPQATATAFLAILKELKNNN